MMDEEDDDREEKREQRKPAAMVTKPAATKEPEEKKAPPTREADPEPEREPARPLSILEIVRLSRGSKGSTENIFVEGQQQQQQQQQKSVGSDKHDQRRTTDIDALDSWRRRNPLPTRPDPARENNEKVKQWHNYAELLQKEYAEKQEEAKREFLRRTARRPSPEETGPSPSSSSANDIEVSLEPEQNGVLDRTIDEATTILDAMPTQAKTQTTTTVMHADTADALVENATRQIKEQISVNENTRSPETRNPSREQATSSSQVKKQEDKEAAETSPTISPAVKKEENPKTLEEASILNEQSMVSEAPTPSSPPPPRPPTPPPVPDRADAWQAFAQQQQAKSLLLRQPSPQNIKEPEQGLQVESPSIQLVDKSTQQEMEREEESKEPEEQLEVADQGVPTQDSKQPSNTEISTALSTSKQPEPIADAADRWRAFALEASKAANNINATPSSSSSHHSTVDDNSQKVTAPSSSPVLPSPLADEGSPLKSTQPASSTLSQATDDNDDSWKAAANWDTSAPLLVESSSLPQASLSNDHNDNSWDAKANGSTVPSQTLTSSSSNDADESWRAAAASWDSKPLYSNSRTPSRTNAQLSNNSWPITASASASWNAIPQGHSPTASPWSTTTTHASNDANDSWQTAASTAASSWDTKPQRNHRNGSPKIQPSQAATQTSEAANDSWRAAAAAWEAKSQQSRSTIPSKKATTQQPSNDSDDSWKAAATWQNVAANTVPLQPNPPTSRNTNNNNDDSWRAAATWNTTTTTTLSSPTPPGTRQVDSKTEPNTRERSRTPRQGRRLHLQAFVDKELRQAGLHSGRK